VERRRLSLEICESLRLRRVRCHLRVPVRSQREHPSLAYRRRQELQHHHRRGVRRVQIVDDHDPRAALRRSRQHLRDRHERRKPPLGGSHRAGTASGRISERQARGALDRAHDLHPGPKRRRAAFFPASRPVDLGSLFRTEPLHLIEQP
jgi:hypothetical protein